MTKNTMNKEMENKMEMLKNMTVKQLREEAKAQGINGMSRKSKEDIIAAIMASTPVEQEEKPEPKKTAKTSKAEKSSELKVALKAFTGMVIDIYTAEKTAKGFTVELKSGNKLEFDKNGKQVTKKNNRYANYIEIIK